MIRRPAVAGQFYSGNVASLKEEVEACVEPNLQKVDAVAAVCPHAGLIYSGRVAGAVYSRIRPPNTYVLIGPNHYGMGEDFSIMTDGVWKMPFGDVWVDSALANEIFKHSSHLEKDPLAQEKEHSLEVQIPLMQYFSTEFQIVPINIRHYDPNDSFLKICEDIGGAIAEAISSVRHRVTIIASSDLTHYQPLEVAKVNDQAALEAIMSMDAARLFKEIGERGITMWRRYWGLRMQSS
jgi:MEMO1 family protein